MPTVPIVVVPRGALIVRSATFVLGSLTRVNCDEVLSFGLRSRAEEVTAAELLRMPDIVGDTVIFTSAEAPAAQFPSRAVTTPEYWEAVPWLAATVTKSAPAGSTSVSVTPEAESGPWFVTVTA